jgi:hypothetical protein
MPARRNVLLVQLPIPPPGPEPVRGNVPLAAGYLKLMAQSRGLDRHYSIEILPANDASRLGDQALIAEIVSREPWLLGFTCYLWNIDRTLWIAREVKSRRPETLVILGGPEITLDNSWVLESSAYDYAAIGEGEATFADLLEHHLTAISPREAIPGIVHPGGTLFHAPRAPMPDLDSISSPYLAGILNAGDQEQLLLETIRGCIFKCKMLLSQGLRPALLRLPREGPGQPGSRESQRRSRGVPSRSDLEPAPGFLRVPGVAQGREP